MPRHRVLARRALAITAVVATSLAAWWWFHLEQVAPLPATHEPAASAPVEALVPASVGAPSADEAAAEVRVGVDGLETPEEQARRRLYESFGIRRTGAAGGDLRLSVVAGDDKVVARDAFLVEIRTTYGDEGAWLDIVRRLRPVEATSRTDVDGIARFQGQHIHGAFVWVMNGQTMVWRTTGPIHWKPVHVEIALGSVTLHGTVHDAVGAPLAGAVILAVPPLKKLGKTEEKRASFVGVSDELGRFELVGLPNEMLTVTCHWPSGANVPVAAAVANAGSGAGDERRIADARTNNRVRVRFGGTPGVRTWRGRIVDEAGTVVVGPNEVRLEHEDGERRVVTAQNDGTLVVPLLPGKWRARAGSEAKAAVAPPLELTIDDKDIERDVVMKGRQVLLRLAAADASVELDDVLDFVSLVADGSELEPNVRVESLVEARQKAKDGQPSTPRRRGVPMGGALRFSWNGVDWCGWSGLQAGTYRVHSWGEYEIVGAPADGIPVDTALTSPTIVDVVLRRAPTRTPSESRK